MAKSSINFKPIKGNSESHNLRVAELDYVYKDLSVNNEFFQSQTIQSKQEEIKDLYVSKIGQKQQKTATPIKEAVVNLNKEHTLLDVKKLTDKLEETYGIHCFQAFIHKDEGKSLDDLNYHAHLLFDWQDKKTGKTIKLNRKDMSQVQTLVAESLGMERGELRENTNRKRLEAVEYKVQQEELKLQELELLEQKKKEEVADAQQEIERVKGAINTTRAAADKREGEIGVFLDTQRGVAEEKHSRVESEYRGVVGKIERTNRDIEQLIIKQREARRRLGNAL